MATNNQPPPHHWSPILFLEKNSLWLATAVLLLMFGLALTSMAQKGPTFDEQGFIIRGVAALRGYPQIRVGHPLGLNALNASFLAMDDAVSLPLDDPSWSGTSFHRPAELFLWEIGNNVEHVLFLARLPSIWLGILLAAIGGRWAYELKKGRWAGLLALIFLALDPNILAHTRLATTDLGLAAFALLAAYTLWRFLKSPSWGKAIIAGIGFGLLQNTKFSAGLFAPLFLLVILVGISQDMVKKRHVEPGKSIGRLIPWHLILMLLIAYPISAVITLWITNGFDMRYLPGDLPLSASMSGVKIPLAGYFEQLLDIAARVQVSTPSFLLGQTSDTGWWYYFPVAFLFKTPIPTLIIISIGLSTGLLGNLKKDGSAFLPLDLSALLIPPIGFFLISLTTDINIGYRHILSIIPFLVVFSAAIWASKIKSRSWIPISLGLGLWLMIATIFIYPDFLAYFNLLAGGPNNGWRSLVDSNLDWGQDIDDLRPWMAENDVDNIWLSYFGEGRPEYYGISYQGLDSFPPRLMNPNTRPFYPKDPAPGVYAISATNLQGVHFSDHNQFVWFREKEPIHKLGYSIFLYEVEPSGEPVALLLSGIQLDELRLEEFAQMESNDIIPRWIDLTQSIVLPRNENAFMAWDSRLQPHELINPYLKSTLSLKTSGDYHFARMTVPRVPRNAKTTYNLDDGQIRLIDAQVVQTDEPEITVITTWEQAAEPHPVKIFIHVLDSNGQLLTQWDGLGAAWEGWRNGDTLVQVHQIPWPENRVNGPFNFTIGLYDPEDGRRWQTDSGKDHYDFGTLD